MKRVVNLGSIHDESLIPVDSELEGVGTQIFRDVQLCLLVLADTDAPGVATDSGVGARDLDTKLVARVESVGDGDVKAIDLRLQGGKRGERPASEWEGGARGGRRRAEVGGRPHKTCESIRMKKAWRATRLV